MLLRVCVVSTPSTGAVARAPTLLAVVGAHASIGATIFGCHEFQAVLHAHRFARTGPRPGGTNATGRKNYAESTWARMLRDQSAQLKLHTSPESKVFRNRFRVLQRTQHVTSERVECRCVEFIGRKIAQRDRSAACRSALLRLLDAVLDL